MKSMMMFLCMALVLALLMGTALADSPYETADTPLTLFAVNVGKGDALLLHSGSTTYLIDSGLQSHWGELSRALKVLQVSHLTGVILTHTDKDHAGGLEALALSSIQVDGWYASPYYEGKESKHPAVKAAALRGEEVTFLHVGDELPLGSGTLTVLGPLSPAEKENNNSLVLLAQASGGRMLLTGDMEFPEEEEMLGEGVIPACEVLKVGNHGNADATSSALIQAVRPQIAVISTSTDEDPDTPSIRVMNLLRTAGAEIFQTQEAASGILVTIDQGEVTANRMGYGELPDPVKGVEIGTIDNVDDRVILRNTGRKAADISGWYIVSERGSQMYVLPEGTMIAPDGELVIGSESSDTPGNLIWPDTKVWHKSKEDIGVLYDVYGREIDRHH